MRHASCLALIGLFLLSAISAAQEKPIDFNRDIRPILSNNCYFCHGPDEKERKGGDEGLRLDIADAAYADLGGRRAIAPGDPEHSELLRRLLSVDDSERMPPEGKGKKLTQAEIEKIRLWIAQGAKYARHWSYESPHRSPLPAVKNASWPRNFVDAHLLARLEAENLAPSAEADRYTLARRAALDLTGLPPGWEEVQAFVNDAKPGAYERYVEKLLASPAYGEHLGRTWLDLARYADSAGYADDPERTIWGYRDYVIRAFNANRPFDAFSIEQLAGDLLPNATPEQRLATAMHRNTLTNSEGGTNDEEFRNVAIVDRVNTTFAVWMGTSIACAQCHSHKYDPISQEDFFRVFAILNNTEDADRGNEAPLMEYFSDLQLAQRAEIEQKLADLNRQFDSPNEKIEKDAQAWLDNLAAPLAWSPATALPSNAPLSIRLPASLTSATALRLTPSADYALESVRTTIVPKELKKLRGQFLRIELPGKARILSLAEVKVLSGAANLAPEGAATQSSVDYDGEAKRAIDGNTSGNYADNSTTHTRQSDDPWWEVDLKSPREIDAVEIHNRTGGLEDRLAGAKLLLLDETRTPVWTQDLTAPPKPSTLLKLLPGRELQLHSAIVGDQSAVALKKPLPPTTSPLLLFLAAPIALSENEELVIDLSLKTSSPVNFTIETTSAAQALELGKLPAQVAASLLKPSADRPAEETAALKKFYIRNIASELTAQRDQFDALTTQLAAIKPSTVPIMRELQGNQRRQTKLQHRGNFEDLGQVVHEGAPQALQPLTSESPKDRLALAHWIVSEKNPLTARVMVNRLWEQVFGIGLVRTSEEFGSQGELPSHPELLDALAIEFMEQGWDVKHLLRTLVTSSAYRQSSKVTPDLAQRDPDNRLLARGPRFRLSAEMVRDQSLAAAGLLSRKMYGPSVKPPQPSTGLSAAFGSGLDWQTSVGEDKYRRGLYTAWRRSSPYPSMMTFDATNREVCTIRRNRTNTPLQALVTLNDPVYVEAAFSLAKNSLESAADDPGRAKAMFQAALLREITPREAERLLQLHSQAKTSFTAAPTRAADLIKSAGALPTNTSNDIDLASWTVVANIILNLDEFLMKP